MFNMTSYKSFKDFINNSFYSLNPVNRSHYEGRKLIRFALGEYQSDTMIEDLSNTSETSNSLIKTGLSKKDIRSLVDWFSAYVTMCYSLGENFSGQIKHINDALCHKESNNKSSLLLELREYGAITGFCTVLLLILGVVYDNAPKLLVGHGILIGVVSTVVGFAAIGCLFLAFKEMHRVWKAVRIFEKLRASSTFKTNAEYTKLIEHWKYHNLPIKRIKAARLSPADSANNARYDCYVEERRYMIFALIAQCNEPINDAYVAMIELFLVILRKKQYDDEERYKADVCKYQNRKNSAKCDDILNIWKKV